MKKTLFFSLFISLKMFGQSVTIVPSNATNTEFLKIQKSGIGLDHRSSNGLIGVGTYAASPSAFIQTHTPHNLNFSTNNSDPFMTLTYSASASLNGNLGIGISSPTQKLQVNGRVRFMNNGETAGVWLNNAANGTSTADGAFLGMKSDNESGIWISNAWRFWVNGAGEINSTALAGTGNRQILATPSGVLIANATPQVWSIAGGAFSASTPDEATFIKAGHIAYFTSGTGKMIVPVNLPNGATITEIKVYYKDGSANAMTISFMRQYIQNDVGGGATLGPIGSLTTTNVTGINNANLVFSGGNPTLDNANYTYFLEVTSNGWSGNLVIQSLKITYTL